MRQSDSRLVAEALAGSSESVEALVLRYQRRAYAVALGIGLRAVEPDDVVQESFLKAIGNLASLRVGESFGGWFLEIVRNTARRHARPTRLKLAARLEKETRDEDDALETRELKERLWREVGRLPEAIREAVFLYYHEGESVRAVAAATGVSAGAVKMRLKRGRELLRKALWSELREELRESRRSKAEWTRKGRTLALTVLSAPASASLLAPAQAAAGAGVSATAGSSLLSAPGLALAMKAAIAGTLAALVLLVVRFPAIDRQSEPDDSIAIASPDASNPRAAGQGVDDADAPDAMAARESPASAEGASGRSIAPATPVAGVVVDARGTAVADATIVAGVGTITISPTARTMSADDGRFRLDLPEGSVQLCAFKEGVGLGLALLDRRADEIRVPLVPLSEISGRVYDQDTGEGIPGLPLVLVPFGTPEAPRELSALHSSAAHAFPGIHNRRPVITDAAGRYAFRGVSLPHSFDPAAPTRLDPLRFRVRFRSRDTEYILSRRFDAEGPDVLIEPGEDRAGLDMALARGAAIGGRVLGPDDRGVVGANVHLLTFSPGNPPFTRSGERGEYRFGGLTPLGTYVVRADHEGLAPAESRIVALTETTDVVGIDVRLTPGHEVRGRLVDESGAPVAAMGLQLAMRSRLHIDWASGTAVTAEDGAFAFAHVSPGDHLIQPFLHSVRVWPEEYTFKVFDFIMPPDRDLADLELVLPLRGSASGEIGGVVVDPGGRPLGGLEVMAVWESVLGRAMTEADGSFRIEALRQGDVFTVVVGSTEYWSAGTERLTAGSTDLRIVASRYGRLHGRVLDASTGEPVEAYEARAVATGLRARGFDEELHRGYIAGYERWNLYRSPRGEFEFPYARPTETRVEVRAVGYLASESPPVRVPPGEVVEGIEIVVTPSSARRFLRGIVVDAESGEPIAGARVRAHRFEFFDTTLLSERDEDREDRAVWELTMSGKDGRFAFERLPPVNAVDLVAWNDGYGAAVRRGIDFRTLESDLRLALAREAVLSVDARYRQRPGEQFFFYAYHREERPWSSAFNTYRRLERPGRVELSGLPPGPFRLAVYCRKATRGRMRLWLIGERRLRLDRGEHREIELDLDAFAEEFGSIDGSVTGVRDSARVFLTIAAAGDPEEFYSHGQWQCDPGGRFELTGLPAGEYVIHAVDHATQPPASARRSVRVTAGEHRAIEIAFE